MGQLRKDPNTPLVPLEPGTHDSLDDNLKLLCPLPPLSDLTRAKIRKEKN